MYCEDHCIFGVSIREVQVSYKRNFRMETHAQDQKKYPLRNIHIYIYIYIYYGEVYQDLNESFCIIRSSFSDVIFTHY